MQGLLGLSSLALVGSGWGLVHQTHSHVSLASRQDLRVPGLYPHFQESSWNPMHSCAGSPTSPVWLSTYSWQLSGIFPPSFGCNISLCLVSCWTFGNQHGRGVLWEPFAWTQNNCLHCLLTELKAVIGHEDPIRVYCNKMVLPYPHVCADQPFSYLWRRAGKPLSLQNSLRHQGNGWGWTDVVSPIVSYPAALRWVMGLQLYPGRKVHEGIKEAKVLWF